MQSWVCTGRRTPGPFPGHPHTPSDLCTLCLPALQPEACRTLAPERDKAAKHCSIQLPDGTSCVVPVRAGLSIKEVLAGLCERHGISGAAVDLFLVGGDKVRGWGTPPVLQGGLFCKHPASGGGPVPGDPAPGGGPAPGGSCPVEGPPGEPAHLHLNLPVPCCPGLCWASRPPPLPSPSERRV